MLRWFLGLVMVLSLAACMETVPQNTKARVLMMGDSMLAVHSTSNKGVAGALERQLRQPVIDRSVIAARYFYYLPVSGAAGLNLTQQYVPGPWDFVVMNGGGNDILFGCGCGPCRRMLDRLVSPDGTSGAIPSQVAKLRKTGAKVIYLGYLRSPGFVSTVEGCGKWGDDMDRRLANMAARDPGVSFLAMSDLVPFGDRSFHDVDTIHPSPKGAAAIAARVAAEMKRMGPPKRR